MWFSKTSKNAKRSRTVRKVEVNLGPVLRYSREKVEFSEPQQGSSTKPAAPVLDLKPALAKALPKPRRGK
jgi:hypothetical protein